MMTFLGLFRKNKGKKNLNESKSKAESLSSTASTSRSTFVRIPDQDYIMTPGEVQRMLSKAGIQTHGGGPVIH
ncbi:hypothetical protein BGZ51_003222 [Haplosporangium sp. Z 767]|nr:hypothetical protein BGZ51_003222 [Haplosporangium sp. Z 767]KAF9187955.1 hypothetical protein BGZ50_001644 [Haplosporangium sp. Z 11]